MPQGSQAVVVLLACLAWFIIVVSAALAHRHMLFEDAKRVLTPELISVREILAAATLSGEVHRKEKIEAAIKCLDSLVVRD